MKYYIKPLLTFAMLLVFARDGLAESHTPGKQGDNPSSASTRLKLRVVIPDMLLLQSGAATSSLDGLVFPTSVTAPTGNGSLVLQGNSGATNIVSDDKTAVETTYTATSL